MLTNLHTHSLAVALVFQYIIPACYRWFPVPQMRAVDLAEILRESIDAKINKCRREIRDSTMVIQ